MVKLKHILQKKLFLFFILFSWNFVVFAQPIYIGLNADMTSGSRFAGIAIQRGIQIAITEINQNGGVLGRKLALITKNHRGIPARGKRNMLQFSKNKKVVAVIGGLHTPVIMAEKRALFDTNRIKIPYISPWAAGTPITSNPWIFRVSVRDEFAGPFLLRQAKKRKAQKIALLLETTAWGRSNETSIKVAIQKTKMHIVSIEWFPWKASPLKIAQKLEKIYQQSPDILILVSNAPEGATIIQAMAKRKKKIPILSHWGITGGSFPSRVKKDLHHINLSFLQTYSFFSPRFPKSQKKVLQIAKQLWPKKVQFAQDLFSPVGTAHAYDSVHLLANAIQKAGVLNRKKIRFALENIKNHQGLVKFYQQPFSKGIGIHHEALNSSDFFLAKFSFSLKSKKWIIKPVQLSGRVK
ncbi:MAG: branched-chain amino acid transport system substrate-binding protein [bacterium]